MFRKLLSRAVAAFFLLSLACSALAQNEPAKPPAPKPLSPTARLMAAKTVFLKNAGGSDVPFNVISDGLQGWGRFQTVNSPALADIVIEVTSPTTGNGISVSSTTRTDAQTSQPAQSTTTSRELSISHINVIVYDAKSKVSLWSATETPRGALREKDRQNNIVEAAQRIVTKFRQRVEPEASK